VPSVITPVWSCTWNWLVPGPSVRSIAFTRQRTVPATGSWIARSCVTAPDAYVRAIWNVAVVPSVVPIVWRSMAKSDQSLKRNANARPRRARRMPACGAANAGARTE
jgi:hypothetical protein